MPDDDIDELEDLTEEELEELQEDDLYYRRKKRGLLFEELRERLKRLKGGKQQ